MRVREVRGREQVRRPALHCDDWLWEGFVRELNIVVTEQIPHDLLYKTFDRRLDFIRIVTDGAAVGSLVGAPEGLELWLALGTANKKNPNQTVVVAT